jgi:flavin reductase (DIM6/NTAB) family NADH-FMN oxidoreductase RutF
MKSALASHLLPCPVVFISTADKNKRDIMIGTAMFLSENDPLLVVSVAKGHTTARLIEQTGEFTVVAASEDQEELYEQLANFRAEVTNKFTALSIPTIQSLSSKPLIPRDSAAWFECKVEVKQEIDDYVVILARVTDYEDMEKPPMIWQKEFLFSLKSL